MLRGVWFNHSARSKIQYFLYLKWKFSKIFYHLIYIFAELWKNFCRNFAEKYNENPVIQFELDEGMNFN